MGLIAWVFQMYIFLTLVETVKRWTRPLVTKHVYSDSELLTFSTINFHDCSIDNVHKCGNIVRSSRPIRVNYSPYTVHVHSTCHCKGISHAVGMVGDDSSSKKSIHWSMHTKENSHGHGDLIETVHVSKSASYAIDFVVYFASGPLSKEAMHRCQVDEYGNPLIYWRYTVTIDSYLTQWTGYQAFNWFITTS
jgi:hypothetical protein